MLPEGIQILSIREIKDYITNVDERDLRENFASDIRGFRLSRTGLVAERDFGSINRYAAANYPATPSAISMIDGFPFYVPSEARTYDLVAGLDTSNNTRLYAGDGTSFEELTQVYYLTIGSISGLTVVSSTDTLKDHLGAAATAKAIDYFKNYVAANHSRGTAGLVTASTNWTGSGTITLTFLNKPDIALGWSAGDQIYLYRCTGILPDSVIGTDRGFDFTNGTTPHLRFLSVEAQQKATMYYGDSSTPVVPRQPIQIRKGRYLTPDSFTLGGSSEGWQEIYDFGTAASLAVSVVGRTITGATNATPIEITLAGHGYANGTTVYISGVGGNTAANGKWIITSTGANTFTLDGSVGNGAYTAGGRVEYVWATSYAGIYLSRDGGESWTLQKDCTATNRPKKLDMIDYQTGYAAGYNGAVWKTTDGGTTWTDVGHGVAIGSTDLSDMSVIDVNNVYVMGNDRIYKTTNAGGFWTNVEDAAMNMIQCSTFVDVNNGWFVDNTKVWYTTNAGVSWSSVSKPDSRFMVDIKFLDANTGWMVGEAGLIFKTTNGGTVWSSQSVAIVTFINSIDIIDSSNVRICSRDGYIAVTTNGGSSWSVEPRQVTDHLWEIDQIDTSNAYAVGDNGKVLRLTGVAGTVGSGSGNGWYIDKEQLLPDFGNVGTTSAPKAGNDADVTLTLGEGIRFTFNFEEETDTGYQNNLRMYATMLYADANDESVHQESDPIFQLSLKPTLNNKFARPIITVAINPALINKSFIGIRFYTAISDQNDLNYLFWVDDPAEYLLAYELLTTTVGWELNTDTEYCILNTIDQFTAVDIDEIVTSNPTNILASLNHSIDLNRSYMTPRFGVKASRQQGAVIVVDEGDRNLRLSCYDGDGVHQEDNFPDVTLDNKGERQQIELTGHGELLGLAIMRGVVYAFKSTELEKYDLQSGLRDIIPIDFYAKKSLVKIGVSDNPNGLLWSGNSGIYYLPIGGGKPQLISKRISNLYDGSKMIDDGVTPYMTDTYRSGIVGGYDQLYREAWIHTEINKKAGGGTEYLNFRYNFDVNKFFVRKLNVTGSRASFFYGRLDDHSFTIGTPSRILKYPNRATTGSSHPYEDDVTSAGVSASKGFETKLRINLGSLYGLQQSPVLWDSIFDYIASVVGSEAVTIRAYANGITTAFDTKTFALNNTKGVPMLFEAIGQAENVELEFELTDANLHNYKRLDIRQIDVRYLVQPRIGTE